MRIVIRLAVLLSLLLGSMTVAAAASADGEMTKEQAGRLYLAASCRNDGGSRLNYAMFRGRSTVTMRQIRSRMTAIKRAARHGSNAEYAFARSLKNPPAPWPVDVQSPIATVSRLGLQMSTIYGNINYATSARGVLYWYNRFDSPLDRLPAPVRMIRANLNLPGPGHGC
jgi:hypothetical protein